MRNVIKVVLGLLPFSLFALTPTSINFNGLVHISTSVAKRLVDIDLNTSVSNDDIDKSVKAFYKQGYFDDIYVTYVDGNLTYHFKEKPLIAKITMKGYKESDEDVQKELLQIKRGSLYDPAKIEEAKKRIVSALSAEGKIDTVVEVEEKRLDSGAVTLEFIVNEGENIVINSLQFSGANGLDTDMFDEVLANKEHQFMGWFFGRNDGKLHIDQIQYDPLRLKDFYMQYGYLDAAIDAPFVMVNFDDYSAQMSYQIEEGIVYRISDIKLDLTKAVIEKEALKEVIKLKRNEPFNIKTFREDADRIKTKIADLGYAFVQVIPDLRKDKAHESVGVYYKIVPGEKVHIRNVIIKGNNQTLDRIIRRELFLGPGDLYNLTDLRDSKNALGRTGYFESSTIEEKRISEGLMDLVVKVKEAPTGNIQLGGGYGSFGGFLLNLSVSDRNIFGSGINVGVRAERSERTNNYSFNISNPRLNDSDFSGNFSVFYSRTAFIDSYTTESDGFSVGVGHRFTRHITGYLSYIYSNNAYSDLDQANIAPSQLIFFQNYNKSSVTTRALFDNTDDYYLPRVGVTIDQSFEKAGLGANADFLKSRTSFNWYQGLKQWLNFDAIFRYKSHYYKAFDTGFLPIAEGFFMGGLGSVRGYQQFSFPYVFNNETNSFVRIAGSETFANSAEFNIPLIPKAKIRLTGFIDWGFIGVNSIDEFSRGGYGAAIEWFSPVGPLQLVFANPINEVAQDRINHFEFTIGQRF